MIQLQMYKHGKPFKLIQLPLAFPLELIEVRLLECDYAEIVTVRPDIEE